VLASVQQENYWQMAEVVGKQQDLQPMQRLAHSARRDPDRVRGELQRFVTPTVWR
jgi:hypothetical protein